MKNLSLASIAAMARDIVLAFIGLAAVVARTLMDLPLPRLLMVCVMAALLCAILPMAVSLFFLALIVKLVAAVVVLRSQPDKA